MNKTINQLIEYGLKNHMISKEDGKIDKVIDDYLKVCG